MKKNLTIRLIVLLFLIIAVSLPGLTAESRLSWSDFITSLKNILGPSIVINQNRSNTQFVTRLDAAQTIIDALSYNDLYDYFDAGYVPFQDIQNLNEDEKKVVILSTQLNPPLFSGDAQGLFRPHDPLTPKEFSFLKEKLKTYSQGNIYYESSKIIEPGIMLMVKKWGFGEPISLSSTSSSGPTVYLQVGAFSERFRAENTSTFLKELGYNTSIVEEQSLFKVRVGPFPAQEISSTQEKLNKQGFPSVPVTQKNTVSTSDSKVEGGAVFSLALLYDPNISTYTPEVVLAHDKILEREKMSIIASQKNAFFAVNAGFFSQEGDPIGILMIKRKVLSDPQEGWYSFGITQDKELVFGMVHLNISASLPNQKGFAIHGINRPNRGNEVVLFDDSYNGKTPRTQGVETVVLNGLVQVTSRTNGETSIPKGGFILQGKGEGADWMLQNLYPGTPLSVKMTILPETRDMEKWLRVEYILSSGPLLFQNGLPGPFGEFRKEIVENKHPRAVIGQTQEGKILFLAVDGRRPGHSSGLTILELVEELKNYQVTDALNLDGGGSVTFYLQGKILNWPSDLAGERKISTAIILK
ncbi:MAG: phosphodiester glycosidase family protein [Atribacter sp.]|jgi:exopolysaccharide biosynthesis protein|uniref:phosphodiester glycosidase family protein n=1 Tax=Atribacter sp. TaxID=2847780 RepID=UPI003D9878C5